MIKAISVLASAGMVLVACQNVPSTDGTASPINTANMSDTVKTMASDEFMGRAPGTEGETKTVDYLIKRFTELGLEPGGRDGKWTDPVTLKHSVVTDVRELSVNDGGSTIKIEQGRDIEISSANASDVIKVEDAPVVFVGFGVSAPERDWDDFADMDLKGCLLYTSPSPRD